MRTSLLLLTMVAAAATTRAADEPPVSFVRDVQPLLARHCFPCHGPDAESREADLRLDVRGDAVKSKAIVPGKPEASEVVARIDSTDEFERMPPPEAGEALSVEQRELLKKWIAAGAKYERHWAFVPPKRPSVPRVDETGWSRNPVDRFVLARLERAGVKPSPEADRYTLLRRVSLDLTGLPPTIDEVEAFVADTSPGAYERAVDRLLASPRYGERWAREWLDLARYADTNGYEKDRARSIWPYRDYVVDAVNEDRPYDRFTVEQLAGDMLPEATEEQRIATGFHRNTMLNEEGGIDPLEYRFHAMVDRVATTGVVWLGLTTGCAQCHTHKYDPISHTDYYRLMALLDNANEPDLIVRDPEIAARRAAVDEQIARLEAELPNAFPPDDGDGTDPERRRRNLEAAFTAWIESMRKEVVEWDVIRPVSAESNLPRLRVLDDGSVLSTGDVTKRDVFTLRFSLKQLPTPLTAIRLEVLPDDRLPARGPGRAFYEGRKGDFFLSEVTARVGDRPVRFATASHSYGKISVGSGNANAGNVLDGEGSTGWSTSGREGERQVLVLQLAEPLEIDGELEVEMLFERHFAASLGRFRFSGTSAVNVPQATATPSDVERLLARDSEGWTAEERREVRAHFLRVAPQLAEARKRIDALRRRRPAFPTTMVLDEREPDNPRVTHRRHRGEYLSPREEVTGGVPAFLPALPADEPANRLTFARWLVGDENPLAARVAVNRAWREFFGAGLVRTSGDFGTQSEPPTHPDLLDWLAVEFVENGWSTKRLHRLIVTSATYRQSSRLTPALLDRDPSNRLLARGPRHRLDAETIRDALLASSGLLAERLGGPSVYPPQPASVTALAYGGFRWPTSKGPDRYRRSLYTFSKRTAPFAAYTAFDGPTGENCIARRDRSNTPLQALTMLNDELFLEPARELGRRTAQRADASREVRLEWLFRRLLTRPTTESERTVLIEYFENQLGRLQKGELDAATLGGPGADARQAAWTLVARALMNVDEAITKP